MSKRSGFLAVVMAVVVGLGEATLVTILPAPLNYMRPLLAGCILLIVLNKPREALLAAALGGLVIDVFGLGESSFVCAGLIIAVAVASFLSSILLTNRSIYSAVALAAAGRVVERACVFLFSGISRVLFQTQVVIEPFFSDLKIMGWDIAMVALGFMAFVLFTRRFKILISSPR